MKIVIIEPIGITEDALKTLSLLLKANGHEIIAYNRRANTEEELISWVEYADVIILANHPLTGKVINACKCLKMVDVAFTGIDHIDVEVCKAQNIMVCNAAGYATNAVAELTIGLIIDLHRNISSHDQSMKSGTYLNPIGRELKNKVLGIVGTGAIGIKVSEIARAFGMRVIAYSRTPKKEALKKGVKYVDLDTLLKYSDIVSIHTPLNKETFHLIDKTQLMKMKKSAVLINTARAAIVDVEALIEGLNKGIIAGAGIDVFYSEPPLPRDDQIFKAKNMILTPHIAYSTQESLYQRAVIVFENIKLWLEGKPQNVQ